MFYHFIEEKKIVLIIYNSLCTHHHKIAHFANNNIMSAMEQELLEINKYKLQNL